MLLINSRLKNNKLTKVRLLKIFFCAQFKKFDRPSKKEFVIDHLVIGFASISFPFARQQAEGAEGSMKLVNKNSPSFICSRKKSFLKMFVEENLNSD